MNTRPLARALLPAVLIALPALLGALIAVLIQGFARPVPVLVFKVDIGTVLFVLGLLLSVGIAFAFAGAWLRERQARRIVQAALQDAEQSRRRFLRRLDHEIKNPLTGLQAALANLREALSPEERDRASRNAARAVERLARLLADLRKLSDLAERPVERLPVEIPQLLGEMIDAAHAQPSFEKRQLNLLVTRVPRRLPAVIGDRDLLGLAVFNLIENALKFTSPDDSVEVRALEDGRSIIVEVADTGPGISEVDMASVFEELYRGENARGVDGSGLGLALAQHIVALHGGQISVRSRRSEPRGTVFTIRLPISAG